MSCGALNSPANGRVSDTGRTTYGQTATYSCNTGYRLVGSSTRTCLATGMWSGSAPTCQGVLLTIHAIYTVGLVYLYRILSTSLAIILIRTFTGAHVTASHKNCIEMLRVGANCMSNSCIYAKDNHTWHAYRIKLHEQFLPMLRIIIHGKHTGLWSAC